MIRRRELLLVGAGAIAAKATASAMACAADPVEPKKTGAAKADAKPEADENKKDEKMEEEHAGHEGHAGHGDAAGGGGDPELVDTLADCVAAGQTCQAHCIRLLSSGDTSMGDCAKAVTDMLAICRATEALAASGSEHLKAIATVCIAGCTACAKACAPHVGHHAECKACKEKCDATVAAMKKMLG